MALYIPVNINSGIEYSPIEAKDEKDAELKWNTVSIGHWRKYKFVLVPNSEPKAKAEKKPKIEHNGDNEFN